ncbi:MAG: hypothetical protein R3B70_14335 [Polyangiaceae bacterium]
MAPEQATSGDVDGRADLYSVGCLLFELLTGKLPFEGTGAVAILRSEAQGQPPPRRRPHPRHPQPVADVVMKALSRHPGARFQSATECAAPSTKPSPAAVAAIEAAASSAPSPRRPAAMLPIALGLGALRSETVRAKAPRPASSPSSIALLSS